MTALESALGYSDVLAMIFDHLAPDRPDGCQQTEDMRHICRKALALSAVTCSTLSHHALNVLWRELDDICPLLKVLPSYDSVGGVYVSRSVCTSQTSFSKA